MDVNRCRLLALKCWFLPNNDVAVFFNNNFDSFFDFLCSIS